VGRAAASPPRAPTESGSVHDIGNCEENAVTQSTKVAWRLCVTKAKARIVSSGMAGVGTTAGKSEIVTTAIDVYFITATRKIKIRHKRQKTKQFSPQHLPIQVSNPGIHRATYPTPDDTVSAELAAQTNIQRQEASLQLASTPSNSTRPTLSSCGSAQPPA